ncbi:MAG: tryptophan-rich sensory protein [Actinobacteria bacterium]|nr:tryptophan-rich sensory protein [Actinomycetota bacterium]
MSQETLETSTAERAISRTDGMSGDAAMVGQAGRSGSATAMPPSAAGSGWLMLASVVLMLGGIVNAAYGTVAILNDQWVVWSNRGAVFFDLTTWGWILFAAGAAAFVAGLGLMVGSPGARALGVFRASISLIANFFFIPAFPLWAISVMVLDVIVIWAITAHGSEVRGRVG